MPLVNAFYLAQWLYIVHKVECNSL